MPAPVPPGRRRSCRSQSSTELRPVSGQARQRQADRDDAERDRERPDAGEQRNGCDHEAYERECREQVHRVTVRFAVLEASPTKPVPTTAATIVAMIVCILLT